MGNNVVSEYWGGGSLVLVANHLKQGLGFPVIWSDISGVWDPSANDYKGNMCLTPIDCSYGYVDNKIHIPRNLDGSGIVIDPEDKLFPDELCDPFRYLKHSYLKTYLVVRGAIPITPSIPTGVPLLFIPGSCSNPLYGTLVGQYVQLFLDPEPVVLTGIIKAICCRRSQLLGYYTDTSLNDTEESIVGIFDTYIELLNISDYSSLTQLINMKPTLGELNTTNPNKSKGWIWPGPKGIHLYFGGNTIELVGHYGDWTDTLIESFNIIQGTVPPSLNQTKYNATQQSYMSCLENGTRKINFTKNTVKQNNVIAAYCTPCSSSMIFTITVVGGTTDITSVPGYTIYIFDTAGVEASLTIDISDNLCGELVGLEYLIVAGGGGGGGTKGDLLFGGYLAGGGGGGGEVLVGTKYISQSQSINILAGNGGLGNQGVDTSSPFGEGQDGSGSYFGSIDVSGGQGALSYTTNINSMGAGNGGASGGNVNVGGHAAIGSGLGPPYQNSVAGGGGGGYLGPGGDAVISTNNDASGGIGGIGVTSDISGTSTDYGVGGGGGALAASNVGGGWGPAYAIGGSSCGNILDPSGGHGAPSSTTNTSSDANGGPYIVNGHNASCYGSGGGGGISMGSVNAQGGNGKRGIVIIKVKNAT